ncbi:MAG: YbaB/EbfC family nucleoid-associated protein [Magnetovibrio sp.]|nr:YbaB/EbfC family nucleoid-associated protein [Magnetovibrio sp.]
MSNLGQMLKQAQELQSKMQEMQEKMAAMEVTGSSGGGMCTVTLNGRGEAKSVKIDPALVTPDDAAVLEDLILTAINDAKGKVEERMREKMSELTGGMPLPPGFQLPF